jgi:hypothetical protein
MKLIMNSCYGKFGELTRPYTEQAFDKDGDDKFADIKAFMYDAGLKEFMDNENIYILMSETLMYRRREHLNTDKPTRHTVISIASAVTSYGRMMLLEVIRCCGEENVFYCDTDSVFTNKEGMERLIAGNWIHPTELGKLKVVKHEEFQPFGPKDYLLDGKRKCKGAKESAEWSDDHTFSQIKFCTGATHIKQGCPDGVVVETVTKRLSRAYKKGSVGADGRVKPIELSEW